MYCKYLDLTFFKKNKVDTNETNKSHQIYVDWESRIIWSLAQFNEFILRCLLDDLESFR